MDRKQYDVSTQSTQRSPRILWVFLCGLGGLGVECRFFVCHFTAPSLRSRSTVLWRGDWLARSAAVAPSPRLPAIAASAVCPRLFFTLAARLLDEQLDDGVVTEGGRAVQRGIAGLVDRVEVAAQLESRP